MKHKKYLPLLFVVPSIPLLFFLIQEACVAKTSGFPLDDAWIFWVFAKNLATGQGFSFNPGQPVLGTTSILWVLVLACSYLVTHNVVFISKFWGVIFFLSAIFLTYRICLFYTRKKTIAFLAVLSFALVTPLIFGALSGMEISLATLLLCLTLFFHLKEMGKKQKIFFAPIFGALCFIARPELVLLYPLLLIDDYIRMSKDKDLRGGLSVKSTVLKKLIIFVFFLSPPFIFSYIVTGSLLPNTFFAKTLDSGLIWAIKNGNLGELFISLTLNPFVWGGTMLATLVCLNIFWAFFWGKGLVLSFFRKDTFIYPLVFLLIPIFRGIVAPVGNSFTGEHRYVSFLLPLLAIFFVVGEGKLDDRAPGKISNRSLRKWLTFVVGISLILAFIFYANPLIKKEMLLGFFSRYYFPAIQAKSALLNFCDFRFIFWFIAIFVAGVTLISITKFFTKLPVRRGVINLLLIAGVVLQIGFLVNRAQRYALSVKNINQMQVHLGKWMNQNIPRGSLVAINDVGAIKFFGNRECLDLEGLVSPQIIPYKILGRDSYIVFLNENRPDYFIIFPLWYPAVYSYLGLWERVLYQVRLQDNIACGGRGHMIVATPDWELFDSTFQRSGLLDIKPYLPRKSFKRRWYDAQERKELSPDWRVYERKGREAERRQNLKEAEKFYLKAESYDPQHHKFYLMMTVFYHNRGDQIKAEMAYQKSIKYRPFPFPDHSSLIGR